MLLLTLLYACAEDRTYEYEEKTGRDHWMQEAMQEHYLWGDSIKDLDWKDYFASPDIFFTRLTGQAPVYDSWSYCSIDTVAKDYFVRGYFDHLNSYGLDFIVMTDPTGETTREYARVTTVLQGSPADRCGLQRGDFIATIDGTRFTSSMTDLLVSGKRRTLIIGHVKADTDANTLVWGQPDSLVMDASEYVEDVAFPVMRSFSTSDGNVVYLQCNRLTAGPYEADTTSTAYLQHLRQLMSEINALAPYALIVDLRLCNSGTIDMACLLASYIVGTNVPSDAVFARTLYRDSMSDKNAEIPFIAESQALSPGFSEVFFITSQKTKGCAEWLIRGVSYAMNQDDVTIYGQTTAGQMVQLEPFTNSRYHVTIHPATAFVANSAGDYSYSSGVMADSLINEFEYLSLYPYGNRHEVILSKILSTFELVR